MLDSHPLIQLARSSIEEFLGMPTQDFNAPKEFLTGRAGVFVTLKKKNGDLRGCIGTIEPTKKNIWEETKSNAIKSANSDPRFDPVLESELSDLEIEISILNPPSAVPDGADLEKYLDPKIYGVIIESTTDSNRRALLLPDIPSVKSWQQQIEICRNKGSIGLHEPLHIERFTVTKIE